MEAACNSETSTDGPHPCRAKTQELFCHVRPSDSKSSESGNIVGFWIPNYYDIRLIGKAGFDKIGISRSGPLSFRKYHQSLWR
jgi:hypothetical protein